jgi:hypothetical protein
METDVDAITNPHRARLDKHTTGCRATGNKKFLAQSASRIFSHSTPYASQISQHATAAKSRLKRTTGRRYFDILAVRTEILPGCTLSAFSRPSEAAVLKFAVSARFVTCRALYK